MKLIISLTILIMKISFIYSDFTSEWKTASEECCAIAFKDDNSKGKCETRLQREMKDSFIDFMMSVELNKAANLAENRKLQEIIGLPENQVRYNGLRTKAQKYALTRSINNNNRDKLQSEAIAARTKEVDDFTKKLKTMCQSVSNDIADENDPSTFTVDVFALIIASGTRQMTVEDFRNFVKYLKENKDDLEQLKDRGADFWQRIFKMDRNAVNVIKNSNSKQFLLSQGFHKFLKWLFQQQLISDFNSCSLIKTLEVYILNKTIIDEDPDNYKAKLRNAIDECA